MSAYDREQWDDDGRPFDGRYEPVMPRPAARRQYLRNHGPDCSCLPHVGCVCDQEEREHMTAEARELSEARALGYTELPANMAADHPFWTRHDRPQRQAS